MRRTIAAVACGLAVLGGVGCQNFSYVQRDPTGGVIEFKASERDAALAKLQQEVGDFEIETEVAKSAPGGTFDPNAPVQPSERVSATSGFGSFLASRDEEKVQLRFRRKGMTPPGLPPAPQDGGLTQAGYQSSSTYTRPPAGAMPLPQQGKPNGALPTPDFSGMSSTGN